MGMIVIFLSNYFQKTLDKYISYHYNNIMNI